MEKQNEIKKPVIGISTGDINGIGMEVILKSFYDQRVLNYCTPLLFADKNLVNYYLKLLEINNFSYNIIRNPEQLNHKKLNLFCDWQRDTEPMLEPGKTTSSGGQYAYKSLSTAVRFLKENQIDALVTGPINKSNIQSDAFRFPGHTEYLQSEFGDEKNLMLMVSDSMKIAVQTGHLPLRSVGEALTIEGILETLRIFTKSLELDFSIR